MKKIIDEVVIVIRILFVCGGGLWFMLFRSPFTAHTIDAQMTPATDLEQIYNKWFSYVHIKHIDLEDTGYYTLNEDGTDIASYCFIGYIGEHGYLVELPAEDVYKLTDDVEKGIKDADVTGEMLYDSEILKTMASDEGYTIKEYVAAYDICRVSIYKPTETFLKNRPYIGLFCFFSGILFAVYTVITKKKIKQGKENTKE